VALTEQHPAEAHSDPGEHSAQAGGPYSVDPEREPSADWGWHGTFPRAGPVAGWLTAFALFAMLIGNNGGHVGDVYLVSIGTLLVVMLIGSHLKARKAKRR